MLARTWFPSWIWKGVALKSKCTTCWSSEISTSTVAEGLVCTRMNGSAIPLGIIPAAARAALRCSSAWYELYCSTSSARCAFFFSICARARAFSARRCATSPSPVAGRPFHMISFLRFAMMFIAMSTLSASYTRRRMFFSSYA